MKCPNCNSENPDSNKFCSECGTKLEVTTSIECPNCHSRISSDSKFCSNCGSKLENEELVPTEEVTPECPKGCSSDIKNDGTGVIQFCCPNCGIEWGNIRGILKCPHCGSDDIIYYNEEGFYPYECHACGGMFENGFNPEDKEAYVLSLLANKDKDTHGNKLSKYFDFSGLTLGVSDSQAVIELGGRLVNAKTEEYILPNRTKCSLNMVSRVDDILFTRKKNRNSLPQFYQSLGLHLDMSKEDFIGLFSELGFKILDESNMSGDKVSASCFCREYKLTLKIFYRSWQEEDGHTDGFISFSSTEY